MKSVLLIPVACLALLTPLCAQDRSSWIPPECRAVLADLATAPAGPRLESVISDAFKLQRSPTCYARLFVARSSVTSAGFADFVKRLESLRTDVQAGAGAGSGGSTNLASKGTTAKILSLAAEYGALTESVNRQVVTVQGSLDGPFAVAVRKNLMPYCLETSQGDKNCAGQSLYSALRRVSYSVSFNTGANTQTITGTAAGQSSGAAQPVTFTASGRQVSAWSARLVLWNARDNISKDFQTSWNKALGAAGAAELNNAAKATIKPLEDLIAAAQLPADQYATWFDASVAALRGANLRDAATVDKVWKERVDLYLDMVEKAGPNVAAAALAFVRAMSRYDFEQRAFVEAIANKPVATLEYVNNRPAAAPATSSVRVIFDKGLGHGVSLTANGAFTVYDSVQPQTIPGVSRLRDAQFALQVQKDLGTSSLLGAAAIAGTYYFQYQNSPAILNVTPGALPSNITFIGLPATATQVFASKGNLSIGQIRLVLGPGQSSVRFPLSISYSNRTELIPKPAWKAQVGVSYDFDALFAR
jgi:hypothetical protein